MTNNSFRIAPFADALFAMDRKWWEFYGREVMASGFCGELFTISDMPGIDRIPIAGVKNSGLGAIMLSVYRGARSVVLIGYDCQHSFGKAHWHGDHPKKMGNAGSSDKWADQFYSALQFMRGIPVINASRASALTCFPRRSIEDCFA